jgi:hypothetical protein
VHPMFESGGRGSNCWKEQSYVTKAGQPGGIRIKMTQQQHGRGESSTAGILKRMMHTSFAQLFIFSKFYAACRRGRGADRRTCSRTTAPFPPIGGCTSSPLSPLQKIIIEEEKDDVGQPCSSNSGLLSACSVTPRSIQPACVLSLNDCL